MAKVANTALKTRTYPLLHPRERILIWKKFAGVWKHKKPEPIGILKKIRKEWEQSAPR